MASTLQEEVEASHWGIDPVPDEHRKLSGLDIGVLWGDLGIGLLVIVTGMFLVAPGDQFGFGMSLPAALACIVLGSLIGCFLLGVGGLIGTQQARPTMVLLRPVLGNRGSWIPSVLNAGQLLGWTAFELWAMALVANKLGEKVFGFSSFYLWLVVFSVIALGLALWGPLGVVRKWMERFGAWVVAAIGVLVTAYLLLNIDLGAVWSRPGAGGSLIFGLPLDLVIVMPISWLPLVADYNRFSRSERGSFWGTFTGYLIANIWFYSLGLLLVFGLQASPDPAGVAAAILSIGGVSLTGILLLAGLLVGETDEAFADVYSSAVSLRNIFPQVDSRILVTGVTVAGALLASRLTMADYETFLFLLGSVFIPLFGVWFADYYVLSNREAGVKQFRFASIVPWAAGFAVYHWIAPTGPSWWTSIAKAVFGSALSSRYSWLGASLPSFLIAFVLHIVVGSLSVRAGSRESAEDGQDLTTTGSRAEV